MSELNFEKQAVGKSDKKEKSSLLEMIKQVRSKEIKEGESFDSLLKSSLAESGYSSDEVKDLMGKWEMFKETRNYLRGINEEKYSQAEQIDPDNMEVFYLALADFAKEAREQNVLDEEGNIIKAIEYSDENWEEQKKEAGWDDNEKKVYELVEKKEIDKESWSNEDELNLQKALESSKIDFDFSKRLKEDYLSILKGKTFEITVKGQSKKLFLDEFFDVLNNSENNIKSDIKIGNPTIRQLIEKLSKNDSYNLDDLSVDDYSNLGLFQEDKLVFVEENRGVGTADGINPFESDEMPRVMRMVNFMMYGLMIGKFAGGDKETQKTVAFVKDRFLLLHNLINRQYNKKESFCYFMLDFTRLWNSKQFEKFIEEKISGMSAILLLEVNRTAILDEDQHSFRNLTPVLERRNKQISPSEAVEEMVGGTLNPEVKNK